MAVAIGRKNGVAARRAIHRSCINSLPCLGYRLLIETKRSSANNDRTVRLSGYFIKDIVHLNANSLAAANRELRERQNNVTPNSVTKTGELGRERSTVSIRDPNRTDSIPSFTAFPPELKRDPEITVPTERSTSGDPALAGEASGQKKLADGPAELV
jgi:hypothetical protein